MTVEELIKKLEVLDQNSDVIVASDEELNVLFGGIRVTVLAFEDGYGNETESYTVVIYGLNGSEIQI